MSSSPGQPVKVYRGGQFSHAEPHLGEKEHFLMPCFQFSCPCIGFEKTVQWSTMVRRAIQSEIEKGDPKNKKGDPKGTQIPKKVPKTV